MLKGNCVWNTSKKDVENGVVLVYEIMEKLL